MTRLRTPRPPRRFARPWSVVALLLVSACNVSSKEEAGIATRDTQDERPLVEHLSTPEQEAMGFPFSEAVRVGDMLYLSGQVGNLPGTTEIVPGGIQAETRQTMDNIQAVLERWGSSLERVVKCTVMIDDMAEWPAMNEVYATYFPGPKPARSALGADGLALNARVEIECWATVDA